MLAVSISVYAVDTFTAINLLAFDKWAGQIEPAIPLRISRWIFAGCIILSFLLLAYRWYRAVRVIKQGGVAKSYLDPLGVRLQSIRFGSNGRGWRRFLVFAELTKSRKGADYVALFTYFSFEAWLRIVFAEGPRQVINAITLYSVMKANLIPEGDHAAVNGHSKVGQFFLNIGVLADEDRMQAVVLFGMLWTLLIWVFTAISLAVSLVLYLLFLWHHIPSQDGGLSGYCRIKINRRMERIVKVKVDKALKKENELRARQDALAARNGLDVKKQPTLPSLDPSTDSLPPLSRTTTMTTLPEYSSRPGSDRRSDDSLPAMPILPPGARPEANRSLTHHSDASWSSFTSNAPLMNSAADMGYSPSNGTPTPSAAPGPWNGRAGPPGRSMTGMSGPSSRSYSPAPVRPPTSQSGRSTPGMYPLEPLGRPGTGMSNGSRRQMSNDDGPPYPGGPLPQPSMLSRSTTWDQQPDSQGRRTPAQSVNPYFPPVIESNGGRNSPGPGLGGPMRSHTPNSGPRLYTPAGAPPPRSFTPQGPPRSYTAGGPPSDRSYTPAGPPSGQPTLPRVNTSDSDFGSYRAFTPEARSMTPASASSGRPPVPPQQGYPPSRGPQRRQGTGGSTFDDILNRY